MRMLKIMALGGACAVALAGRASAEQFDIPRGDLAAALDAYTAQTGIQLLYSSDAVSGRKTLGVKGELAANAALARILIGTGYTSRRMPAGAISIVPEPAKRQAAAGARAELSVAAAASTASSVETVVVTSSKIKGDIQTVPIAITALSQEQLTSRQIAGGPDLVKEVPNLTFTKTNFSGYSIQIRGIGTQAISVTTDPAVAVALNDIPFIRNHFFEQEFFDVNQVEVLRGPQGTLYGRNATAGVVNVITAKPTDQFEAMASADIGNYHNRRYEGMVNIPIVDDRLDIRVAGEWTKRDGYSVDTTYNTPIDGRDLWSSRVTIGWKPAENVQTYLVWEHFSENDDRMRTAKQLCETSVPPTSVDGVAVPPPGSDQSYSGAFDLSAYLSQGCVASSLYSPVAFGVPYGPSLPYVHAAELNGAINADVNPYAETIQSRNLRDIQSEILPRYSAKNDVVEFNADYKTSPSLTLTSQTGYNNDFLYSTEDYNRFDTSPGIFAPYNEGISSTGVFCDPQLGCSDRLVAQDLSDETAWQLSQEFRLASNFSGPFNFSVGGNYLHYVTEENYYVFINALTLYALAYKGSVSANNNCLLQNGFGNGFGYRPLNPITYISMPSDDQCNYIDPNPLSKIDSEGHNYFLSQNPYFLNSYAGFGETYYNITPDLKLTTGLRFTEDQKTFFDIPSEVVTNGWGYYQTGTVRQKWDRLTGRAVLDWTPKLDFTDQTLIYGSYAHGYKAGGANPPGAALLSSGGPDTTNFPDHPLTFKPEYIEAFELGTKNTLLDGGLTVNGDVFYYNYTGYQISEIVDRTAINNNYNAHVEGAELESGWEPLPGLKLNFAGGWEDARAATGDNGIDLIDRTASNPDWMVVKPYPTQASNCILPTWVVAALLETPDGPGNNTPALVAACGLAYLSDLDPVTGLPYTADPTAFTRNSGGIPAGYIGWDPATAPNKGEGITKNLSGNQLPNAPHFTTSLSADYTMPVSEDWAATVHSDFYWQSQSFARIFDDRPYDKLRGYSNVNLALILTSASGWQVMGYLKNVFNTTAITGDFLNSDDSGLTTNVFLTDPRLFGVRVTKNW